MCVIVVSNLQRLQLSFTTNFQLPWDFDTRATHMLSKVNTCVCMD